MDLDEITVIVPTKNESRNIVSLLDSIPENVAVILVDSSSDDTVSIALSQRRHSIEVIQQTAIIPQARNIGASAASSRYLIFTDADIVFAADYFKILLALQHTDALYGLKHTGGAHPVYNYVFTTGQKTLDRIGIPAVSGSNLLVSKQVLDWVGGFDERLVCNEDSEFGWRIASAGYTIRLEPKLIVYENDHRRLARGATTKMAHSLLRCTLLYANLMPARLRSSDWGYWSDNQAD